MVQYFRYVGQAQAAHGRVMGLPFWARLLLVMLALPGLVLLGLSIVAVIVSLLALLLMTVPAFRVLSSLGIGRPRAAEGAGLPGGASASPYEPFVEGSVVSPGQDPAAPPRPRRNIEVRIVEAE